MKAEQVKIELKKMTDRKRAAVSHRFFKTGPGEYGQGDLFLGVTVPDQRKIARKFTKLKYPEIKKLLLSSWHEHRLTGLLILIDQYEKADSADRKNIFNFYCRHLDSVNNWDLVDLSAPRIMGDYLIDQEREILYRLASSKNLWHRRISIVATLAFIRNNDFRDTLKITRMLLKDDQDLIHKAAGWMLREVAKRDLLTAKEFIDKYHSEMPRTMLRYALERLSSEERKYYLKR